VKKTKKMVTRGGYEKRGKKKAGAGMGSPRIILRGGIGKVGASTSRSTGRGVHLKKKPGNQVGGQKGRNGGGGKDPKKKLVREGDQNVLYGKVRGVIKTTRSRKTKRGGGCILREKKRIKVKR